MTASALLDRIAEPGAVGYVLVNARGERAVAWGLARVLRPSEQRGSQWWRDPQALSGPGRPRVHPPARRGGRGSAARQAHRYARPLPQAPGLCRQSPGRTSSA